MRLSKLVPHTSSYLGIPESQVKTVARVLQPAGLISSTGRNPQGAEMTEDDKVNLLLGVCGVEVANRAADYVREWRRAIRADRTTHPKGFAFLKATNVKDLIVDLIRKDLDDGGPLDVWLKESRTDLEKAAGRKLKAAITHEITLDFFVDEFALELRISRNVHHGMYSMSFDLPKVESDSMCVRFIRRPPPHDDFPMPERLKPDDYIAHSKLIRRLNETNLIGWGQCLREDSQ